MAARASQTEEERYWAKVARSGPDECWEWTAYRNKLGYGMLGRWDGIRTVAVLAHRIGWKLAHDDPGELCVLHHCDNPPCQNPGHLFLGTRRENSEDMTRKGRRAVGVQLQTKLTPELVREVFARYEGGEAIPQIADALCIHKATLNAAIKGRTWTHLGLVAPATRPGRLNAERVHNIRKRFANGESHHTLAAEFGVGAKYIYEVASGRRWAAVV